MKRRKQFVTPKVVQVAEVCLERDLLARSGDDPVATNGMYFEDTNYGEDDQEWSSE